MFSFFCRCTMSWSTLFLVSCTDVLHVWNLQPQMNLNCCFSFRRRLSWVQWASLVILFLSIVSLTTGSGGSQKSIAVPGLHSNPLSTPSNSCLLYTQLLEQMRNSRYHDKYHKYWNCKVKILGFISTLKIKREMDNKSSEFQLLLDTMFMSNSREDFCSPESQGNKCSECTGYCVLQWKEKYVNHFWSDVPNESQLQCA